MLLSLGGNLEPLEIADFRRVKHQAPAAVQGFELPVAHRTVRVEDIEPHPRRFLMRLDSQLGATIHEVAEDLPENTVTWIADIQTPGVDL